MPVLVRTEKQTCFSYLATSRSEAVSQGRAFSARRASGRSEAKSLYGRRSGGYTRVSVPGRRFQPRPFAFNRFTPQQPRVTAR